MHVVDFSLPLKNPVLIFSLVLFIILFAPILLNRIKIPSIIGLIVAGIIIGPYGLNILMRDSSIQLFGTVGLLYIMFLAGLEIDMGDFNKNKYKSIYFGLLTFLIPMTLGTVVGYYTLKFSLESSILMASMFASHTLLAYPIASRFGIAKSLAVNITVGGTVITDTLALLVLAVISGSVKGELNQAFWIELGVSVGIFGTVVLVGFPILGRWFFKKIEDSVLQYIFILAMVFLAAFIAELAGVEAIIGAFLAGLALNRLVPTASPLMNRVEFVGNALFIPFFLIGVGMLVDLSVLVKGPTALFVAVIMTTVATGAKWIAAFLTQKTLGMNKTERNLIFGLSNAQAAATLAVVLVGYKIIIGETADGEPIRLLNEDVLNGTIIMILATCTISSFAVERSAREMAIQNIEHNDQGEEIKDRLLIPLSEDDDTSSLIDLAILSKIPKNKEPLYTLFVVDDQDSSDEKMLSGKKILEKAAKTAAGYDSKVEMLSRFDLNLTSGIIHTVKEHRINDVLLGWKDRYTVADKLFGSVSDGLLKRMENMLMIFNTTQPLNTIKRIVVTVPQNAEYEIGFIKWYEKIRNLSRQTAAKVHFWANEASIERLKAISEKQKPALDAHYHLFDEWEDFLVLSKSIKQDDLLIAISARKATLSYHNSLDKIPSYLAKHFKRNNFIIIYPQQTGFSDTESSFSYDSSMSAPIEENIYRLNKASKFIKNMFKKS